MRLCFSFPSLSLSASPSRSACVFAISMSVCVCVPILATTAFGLALPSHTHTHAPLISSAQQSHISGYLSLSRALYHSIPLVLYLDIFVLNNFHYVSAFFSLRPTFPACTKNSTVFFLFEHLTKLSLHHPSPPLLTVAHLAVGVFIFFRLLRGQQLSVCF